MLRVIIELQDLACQGVDLIVILLIAGSIKFHLVLPSALVMIELCLNERHLAFRQSSMVQRDAPCLGLADAGIGAAPGLGGLRVGLPSVGAGPKAVRVRHQAVPGAAGKAGGPRLRVPAHGFPHQPADRPQRQIGGAAVEHRVDRGSIGISEGAGRAVHHNGKVGAQLRLNDPLRGIFVQDPRRGGGGPGSRKGDRQRGLIPVDILVHQHANSPNGQIGGAVVKDRVYLCAAYGKKGLRLAVHLHRYVRGNRRADSSR